ncbi:hypothetical protein [Streptomyces yaizuensis]|uniref:XRE family transcriptional regulator n=1 Tax=Streptomyces yaizuensis TaxID=2989713 RepID=A0ABQ5NV07_9ACTN|nr:hypothetical protein [Streptomyces sp. YSPA8]GLF93831.1 hypothetical protein SYYSPA8_06060 [Streptomyces sp. YSPA8]
MALAKLLRWWWERAGRSDRGKPTQQALALRIACDQATLSRYLNPRHASTAPPHVIELLHDRLGAPPEELAPALALSRAAAASAAKRRNTGSTGSTGSHPASEAPVPDTTENAPPPTGPDAPAVLVGRPATEPRPPGRARRWSLVKVVPAALLLIVTSVAGWLSTLRDQPLAPGPEQPSAPLLLPPAAGSGAQCKNRWKRMTAASLYVLPCIERRSGGLALSARVRPMTADGIPGGATVWIWLMRMDDDAPAGAAGLRHCRLAPTRDDGITTCGPFTAPAPVRPGTYATWVSARVEHAAQPPGWGSRAVIGRHSPVVPWPSPPRGGEPAGEPVGTRAAARGTVAATRSDTPRSPARRTPERRASPVRSGPQRSRHSPPSRGRP